MWAVVLLVGAGVIVSTILHHLFPSALNVPPNVDLLRSTMIEMFIADLMAMALAYLCVRHAWTFHGGYRAIIFLAGSFVFTGVEESMWIIGGRFHGFVDSYYFTRGFFWFLETPVSACLGWFWLAYGCMYMAKILIPKAQVLWRASLAAFLAMDLDLWMDPIMTRPAHKAWVWLDPDQVYLFSIPLLNFVGWFMLVFIFAIVYEYLPGMMERRGPAKAAIKFFGVLMLIEVGILVFFICYLTLMRRLFPDPINFTLWGI
jgi:hypothetical protein